jgi:SNF2 family DNA or RNA helicase
MDFKPLWPDHRYYEHQKYAIKWMYERPIGGILADAIGLGKMIEIIGLIVNKPLDKTLILVPLAMLDNWIKTLIRSNCKVYVASKTYTWIPLNGTVTATNVDVYITNIDKVFKPFIQACLWDRFIIDEAHAIRYPKSLLNSAANTVHSLSRWAITNTPIIDSLADLTTLLKFVIGPVSGAPIKELIHSLVLCRTMDHLRLAGSDAPFRPDVIDVICSYANSAEQETYTHLIDTLGTEPIALYKKLKTLRSCLMAKLAAVKKIMNLSASKRYVILCSYPDELQLIAMYLSMNCPIEHVIIDNEERDTQIEFAKSTKSCAYIVQIKTAYMGLNLTDFDSLIVMTPWWSNKIMKNIVGCIVRVGQQSVVEIYNIFYPDEYKLRTNENFKKYNKSNDFMQSILKYADHKISI